MLVIGQGSPPIIPTQYSYYNNNWLKSVQSMGDPSPTTYEYDKLGNRTKTTLPNGVYTTYKYDPDNYHLLGIYHRDKKNSLLGKFEYTYDEVGNRLTMTDNVGTHTYGYDNLYQLTRWTHPVRGYQFFNYDKVGNRTVLTENIKKLKDGAPIGTYEGTTTETYYSYNNANELTGNVGQGFSLAYTYVFCNAIVYHVVIQFLTTPYN